jgi:RHS repeat-associated protein
VLASNTSSCITDEPYTTYAYLGDTFLPTTISAVSPADSLTRTTVTAYDAAGRTISQDGPLTGTDDAKYVRYDAVGRKIWEIGERAPNGLRLAKKLTYRDADDKVSRVESGTVNCNTNCATVALTLTLLQTTDTTYDSRRYAIREKTYNGATTYAVTDRSFLDRGLADCMTVRMNLASLPTASATGACSLGTQGADGPDRITKNNYDSAGQLTKVQKAYGTSDAADYVTYAYTANGKQQYVTDANGNKAQFAYDPFDRLYRWYFPSKTSPGVVNTADYEEYLYDLAGNRTSLRKRDGSTLTFQYDALNRITRKTVPSRADLTATQTRDVYYDYDAWGRQLTAKFDSGAAASDGITNTYNGFGELLTSQLKMGTFTKGIGSTTQPSLYDAAGRRTQITHPDGQVFTYGYDAMGRLTGVYQGAGTAIPLDVFTYNSAGLLSSRGEGGTLASSATYAWDDVGRLLSQTDAFSGGTGNVGWTFALNPASQITSETRSNDSYAFGPISAVNRPYAVNGLNQYSSAGPATFTYDGNGNLISSVSSSGTSTYVYDIENRLVQATSGGKTTNLIYDPLGRLFQVDQGANANTTRFLYDGDALAIEFNSNNTITSRYVHGSNSAADDPLVWYSGSSLTNKKWLHADHLGSIVAVTTSVGANDSINSYDEYGVPKTDNQLNNVNTGRFQYTGQAWIDELGMYYYKARIYSPTIGRFLQADQIGYEGGMNIYAYTADNPVNAIDFGGNTTYNCTSMTTPEGLVTAQCSTIDDGNWNTTVNLKQDIQSLGFDGNLYHHYEHQSQTYSWTANLFGGARGNVLSLLSSWTGADLSNGSVQPNMGTISLPSPGMSLRQRAQDPRVQDVVDQLYRRGAKIGNGSSMDAYRADGSHLQKLMERRTQLERLSRDPVLSSSDKQVVHELLDVINNALGGR